MPNIELIEKMLPVAPLKIAAMESCSELGQKVNDYIVSFRQNTINEVTESPIYVNYRSNNYLVDCACPRFGSGEAKGILKETIRGTDFVSYTHLDVYKRQLLHRILQFYLTLFVDHQNFIFHTVHYKFFYGFSENIC